MAKRGGAPEHPLSGKSKPPQDPLFGQGRGGGNGGNGRVTLTAEEKQQIIAHLLRGDEPNSVEVTRYRDGQYSWGLKLYFGARLPLQALVGADQSLRGAFLGLADPVA